MKKILSVLLSVLLAASAGTVALAADFNVDQPENAPYQQPFPSGTHGSERFRIPAIITLNDGSVLAAADKRYGHGSDSPQNLDTLLAKSADGYTGWQYTDVNTFDDYADGENNAESASFIDPALVQSKETGRIFLIVDAFPSGGGARACEKGTGFVSFEGKKALALTSGSYTQKIDKFEYVVGTAQEDGLSPVLMRASGAKTAYAVDSEFKLYKNGAPVMIEQNVTGVAIHASVFYKEAPIHVYKTMYQYLRYSDDNGATWSAPVIITPQIKYQNESFFGIAPGKGFVTTVGGKERIIFCAYDNSTGTERASTIYSDDNGVTWHRGERVKNKLGLKKTSESQIIALSNGDLRMFSRTDSNFIAYCDSKDGGDTWTTARADRALEGTKNCMVSVINTDKEIDGKPVVVASFAGAVIGASHVSGRADGVIKVGTEDNGEIKWLSTYHVNNQFFAYSCLSELSDGKIGLLFEDDPAQISYKVLSLDAEGKLADVDGTDASYTAPQLSGMDAIMNVLKKIEKFLLSWFDLI